MRIIENKPKEYYARFNSKRELQPLNEHLEGVGNLCRQQGEKVGLGNLCYLAGILHDIGKYSDEFQERLSTAYFEIGEPKKVNHSNAGAELIFEYHKYIKFKAVTEIISNAILTHHGTLLDYFNLEGNSPFLTRLDMNILSPKVKELFFNNILDEIEFTECLNNADVELRNKLINIDKKNILETMSYITNYVYSVLIDSDRTNSYQFEIGNVNTKYKDNSKYFKNFSKNLEKLYTNYNSIENPSEINKLRTKMANDCLESAKLPKGIYRLSTPVGGGKTLSSMRFALNHVLEHNMDRIFYMLPYTVIISQNSKTIQEILGNEEQILEHHSEVVTQNKTKSPFGVYVSENWNTSIVISTFYQLLQSIFSRKSQSLRRFSKLANSVIIIDEIQSMPVHTIQLMNTAINFLSETLGCTVLICTATQPNYSNLEHSINKIGKDIINITDEDLEQFKRVTFIDNTNIKPRSLISEEVAEYVKEKFNENEQVLCILNTKKVVKEVYELLRNKNLENTTVLHLSTSMCVSHRHDIINKMKEILNKGEKIICITTPLIEAGVDISFKSVVRSLSGLDNIIQASGRANRNGEYENSNIYLIDVNENLDMLPTIKSGKETTKIYLEYLNRKYISCNPLDYFDAPINIDYYSNLYFKRVKELTDIKVSGTSYKLSNLLTTAPISRDNKLAKILISKSSLRTIQSNFKVYKTETNTVIVNYGDSLNIVEEFTNHILSPNKFSKNIQKFSVNLFDYEYEDLKVKNLIQEIEIVNGNISTTINILDSSYYNKEYGIGKNNDLI